MFIYRPIQTNDIESLIEFSKIIGIGNAGVFQVGKEKLEETIESSVVTFTKKDVNGPGFDDVYVFVLTEETGKILGLYKVNAYANGRKPFYSYKLQRIDAGFYEDRSIDALFLSDKYTESSMISSNILHPDYRCTKNGRLLMYGYYFYLSQFFNRFFELFTGEYRGNYYKNGCSIFWRTVIRHFLEDWDYSSYLKAILEGQEDRIYERLPKGPLYIPLLPKPAQKVLGKVHQEAKGSFQFYTREGFSHNGHFAYSTAAPIVAVNRQQMCSLKKIKKASIRSVQSSIDGKEYLVGNTQSDLGFRVCRGKIKIHDDHTITIDRETSNILDVHQNNLITYLK